MAKLLTIRKQKWISKFNPSMVQGVPLVPNASIEARYQKQLDALIAKMTGETKKTLVRLFKGDAAEEYFAQDESISSQARILTNKLMEKFDEMFARSASSIAESMVNASDAASSASVHASLQQLSGGLSLPTSAITAPMKEVLKASIAENVQLIKSIPQQYFTQVQGAVMRSITTGNGMKDLVPFLEKQDGITKRRARMIANDQTRKVYNQLSKSRMENVGLKKFKWLHTAGSNEPRKRHIELSGQIFSFDDLPVIDDNGERGIPGQAINCRCRMVPVIEFGDE